MSSSEPPRPRPPSVAELDPHRAQVRTWLEANRPPESDFLLPETFVEVGSDRQFEDLRDWQPKVYGAGYLYLGLAWPAEYGGRVYY